MTAEDVHHTRREKAKEEEYKSENWALVFRWWHPKK
jgi:hypothetical protein